MAARHRRDKLYPPFTLAEENIDAPVNDSPADWGLDMVALAIALFIGLFGWGAGFFGWSDPEGKVQLALGVCFILGVLSGYKVRD